MLVVDKGTRAPGRSIFGGVCAVVELKIIRPGIVCLGRGIRHEIID